MSRTIGYNPDPTPSARRDSKGRFRIEVRVMEAMLAIVGHSQCVTHARCGTCGRFLGQRSWARRQFARVKPLPRDIRILLRPEAPAYPNLTWVGGLVVPGCGSDCTFRVLGIVTDSGTSKTNQPEWVVPGS